MSYAKESRNGSRVTVPGGTRSRTAGFGAGSAKQAQASFSSVPGLTAVLDAITVAGDAIVLARTSDGGAIVIQLLDGDKKPKVYCVDQEQLNDNFAWLANAYADTMDKV